MPGKRVVIVEDDVLIASFFADICRQHGIEVKAVAHTAEDGIRCLLDHRPDYGLVDVRLGGKRDGVDVGMAAIEEIPEIKIIYITGSNEPPSLERIRSDHPYKILIKPVLACDIIEAMD